MPKLNVQQNNQNVIKAFQVALETSHENLLDNAYFAGGGSQLGDWVFPINQRGQTSYAGGYGIDRWRCWQASTVTLTAAGLTFATGANGDGLFQYFPKGKFESLYGETVTASLLLTDGTLYTATGTASADCWITKSFSGGYFGYVCNGTEGNFRINLNANQSKSIKAAKLEKGTYSTILNDVPPNFGEELAKCQRYLRAIYAKEGGTYICVGMGTATNIYTIEFPFSMRATPTPSLSGTIDIYAPSGMHTVSSVAAQPSTTDTICLNFTVNGTVSVYEMGHFNMYSGARLLLSAEI